MKSSLNRFAALSLTALSAGCLLLSGCSQNRQAPQPQPETTAQTEPAVPEITLHAGDAPAFSAAGGFYSEPFDLTLFIPPDAAVYYTTDGSEPTADSTKYESPIHIADRSAEPNGISMKTDIAPADSDPEISAPKTAVDKITVIRAVAVDGQGTRSETVTQTYFVGFDQKAKYYSEYPIISMTVNEADLYDSETGIYVLGKTYENWRSGAEYDPDVPPYFMPANYTQHGKEWEREANLQYFADGKLALSQNVGIRIHGGATRSYPQKSFNLYARSKYGEPKLAFDFFSGTLRNAVTGNAVTEFDTLMLRNGGNDALFTRFRDKLNQALVADRQFLTQAMTPCTVFLNGEFWGHYEITEKLDADFIHAHYDIPKQNICMIKKDELEEGTDADFTEWTKLREWIRETDFSDSAAYEQLCSSVDMQGFMDYMSSEIYMNNANWGESNSAMWRASVTDQQNAYADGKWRFIMFDTEYSTGIYGQAQPNEDSFETILRQDSFLSDLFRGALKSSTFRQQFRQTFTEIADSNFAPEKVNAEIDRLEAGYHDMVIDTYNRFWCSSFGGYAAESNYQEEVGTVRAFYENRRSHIMEYLEQYTQ